VRYKAQLPYRTLLLLLAGTVRVVVKSPRTFLTITKMKWSFPCRGYARIIWKAFGDGSVGLFGEISGDDAASILISLQYKVQFEIQIATLACDNIGPWLNFSSQTLVIVKVYCSIGCGNKLVKIWDFLS
jgi:hypothetical protein